MAKWLPLTVLLCFLPATPLLALEGRVLRQDGTPVVDATVSILGHSGTARTDREGRFHWQPDPRPPFELLIVLSNGRYMAPVLVEELPVGEPLIVEVAPVTNDTITVLSGATPHIEVPAASGMTLVRRSDLATRQPVHLVDALQSIPGVSQVSEGHAAVPVIRGLARGRTLLLVDGGRVATERRAGPSATYLDPFLLEGVEVARGPSSVAYGSDAFGGVIHARTRRAEPGEPLKFRFAGTLGFGLPEGRAGVEVSKGFARGGILLAGTLRQYGDYDSPLGEISNSGAKNRSLLGRGNSELGQGRLSLGWQTDRGRDTGRPRDNSDELRFFYPREDSDRFTVSYDLDPTAGFSRLTLDFFLGGYRLLTRRDQLPTSGEPRRIDDSDVSASDFGFRLLTVKPLNRSRLELGADINGRFGLKAVDTTTHFDSHDEVTSSTSRNSIEDARRRDVAAFGSLEVTLNRFLNASGGLRLSHLSSRNSGGDFGEQATSDNALSGFAALAADPLKGLNLTAQVSRGFREPTLSDRYFKGVTGRGFVTGNPDLEPETSFQFDFATRYSLGNTQWAVYAYRYRIDDLIERFESGQDQFFFRNRGRALIYGIELEGHWQVRPTLRLQFGAHGATGRASDTDEPLDDVPARRLSVLLHQTIRENGYLQLQGSVYDRDQHPGPTEKITPGYGVLDVIAGWQFDALNVRFQLRNLLDKDYPASPDRRTVPAPGRSGSVTVMTEF